MSSGIMQYPFLLKKWKFKNVCLGTAVYNNANHTLIILWACCWLFNAFDFIWWQPNSWLFYWMQQCWWRLLSLGNISKPPTNSSQNLILLWVCCWTYDTLNLILGNPIVDLLKITSILMIFIGYSKIRYHYCLSLGLFLTKSFLL